MVHKEAFFSFLHKRWTRLFDARFDVVLYDLTSTYFESDPPFEDKRQFGYSRDKRSDCVQVVIALIVTPDGFPLACEVMPGNTSDNTTLAGFVEKIEKQYGRSDRVWIMDRGIPTEATLATMREGDAPVHSLVGTPKGRLTKLETSFLGQPWQAVRPCVEVKLLAEEGELYILVHSESRVLKERSMRTRRLKKLWQRLHELRRQSNPMTRSRAWWTSSTRRWTQRIAPASPTGSRRNALAAALRLGARSACATTASSVSSSPGSHAARQSGSRLKVVWLSGQYQRAICVPRGVLRA